MKTLLLSLGLSAGLFAPAGAQQYISIGPVVGFGHSGVTNGTIKDDIDVHSKFHPSFDAGIGLIYAKHEHWGFGGELLYSQEGFKKQGVEQPLDVTLTQTAGYIRVPLKVYYFFGGYKQKVRPKVYLGPSFGFKIMDDYKYEGNNDMSDALLTMTHPGPLVDFKTFDFGLQAGAGVNITLSRALWLNLDINYYQGLLDAADDVDNSVFSTHSGYNMNQHLRFQAGVLFGLGKSGKGK